MQIAAPKKVLIMKNNTYHKLDCLMNWASIYHKQFDNFQLQCFWYANRQGSHSHWKSRKNWKREIMFSIQGKIREFDKFEKNQGKIS